MEELAVTYRFVFHNKEKRMKKAEFTSTFEGNGIVSLLSNIIIV